MKKLLISILLLSCLSGGAYWWFSIVEVQRSTASVQVDDARLRVWYNLVCPTYADTAGANGNLGLDYIGALIHTKTPAAIYFRDTSAAHHKWTILATTPASPIWGLITGTLSSQTDLQTALNAKQNLIALGTTAQYFRGDLSLAVFPTDLSSFTNGPGYLTGVNVTMSVTGTGSVSTPLKLVNDNASPGANMFYGTNNGGTKGWISQSSIVDTNYKFATLYDSVATYDRYFGLHGFNFYLHNVYPQGAPSHITLENMEAGPGLSNQHDYLDIDQGVALVSSNDFPSVGASSQVYVNGGLVQLQSNIGLFRVTGLLQANDTTTYKPLAADGSGNTKRMDGWAGSGGGGGAPVVQTITAGPTVTINNSTDVLQVNSTSVIASLAITLPTTWPTSKVVKICFTANGTITSGNIMVTSISVINGSGQTLSQAITPAGSAVAGENIVYQEIGTVDQRLQ